jgi:hypothetical protein
VTRQGIFDSLFCGCIPVFFADCLSKQLAYETMYDPFLPQFSRTRFGAGPWAVPLNATAIMQHPKLLIEQLGAISQATRQQMRSTITALLPLLHYSTMQAKVSAHKVLSSVLHDRRAWLCVHRVTKQSCDSISKSISWRP